MALLPERLHRVRQSPAADIVEKDPVVPDLSQPFPDKTDSIGSKAGVRVVVKEGRRFGSASLQRTLRIEQPFRMGTDGPVRFAHLCRAGNNRIFPARSCQFLRIKAVKPEIE